MARRRLGTIMATNLAPKRRALRALSLTMTAFVLGAGVLAPAASALGGPPLDLDPLYPVMSPFYPVLDTAVERVNRVTTNLPDTPVSTGCWVHIHGPKWGWTVWVDPCPPFA
jgi:hypothetical protein